MKNLISIQCNMEELYTGDAFGNQLKVGDIVVAATQIIQSPAIKIGTIIAMSKGKPYETWDTNDGNRVLHKVAKWRIKWSQYPLWTYKRYLTEESIVHGLNLFRIS